MSNYCAVKAEFFDDGIAFSAYGERVRFHGDIFSYISDARFDLEPHFSKDGVLSVKAMPRKNGTMKEYYYFDGVWQGAEVIEIAQTHLSGIGVFVRTKSVSFFLSLDFPYSKIVREGMGAKIGCDPREKVKIGTAYHPHTLTVGAAQLSGKMVGQFDCEEIEAFSAYVRNRMPKEFQGGRPIFSSTCITNRMTDTREGRIFYSMYDNPTLTLDIETLKQEVRLCAELGIEYYQVFEGFFDWEEDGSSERNLKELVALGKELGVRVGDYMTMLELNCWHYNYYDRTVQDPSMCALEPDGKRRKLCYGDFRVGKMLEETILPAIKRNGEEMICFDGNVAVPCMDESHGHAPGSYYRHIKGVCAFMSKLNALSPYFMCWSNAGNWIEFMPKLLWYNPNVYLSDPHPREYNSTLNMLKYYGDCRREQMVTVHNKYFVPYSAFTNCEYYAFKHSRVEDMAFFEYSFLQGLAVTPNICLGELRTFLERIPAGKLGYVKAFIKKWLAFIRENIDCWKNTLQLGDSPGAGANEAYAHIDKDHGYLCLVNQNQSENQFTFKLDESIGLSGNLGDRFLLSEIYPKVYPLSEQSMPGALYGEEITLSVDAYAVRFIKIEPYFAPIGGTRLYGAPAVEKEGRWEIEGECGQEIPMGIWSEKNSINTLGVQTNKTVPKYWFPSYILHFEAEGNGARFHLKMPREEFRRVLSQWSVEGGEPQRLLAVNSDFFGAYVHNLYREDHRVSLYVNQGNLGHKEALKPAEKKEKSRTDFPRRAAYYETKVSIPFIEWPAMANEYGKDEVIELVFSDNQAVRSVRAFLDGAEVEVCRYIYPASNKMWSYYIELFGVVSSGTTPTLRIEVDWNQKETRKYDSNHEGAKDAQVIGQSRD